MDAILFLYRKSFINRMKKALKKPVTYIYFAFIIMYFVMIFWSFGPMIEDLSTDHASSLTALLTISVFIFMPANLISYSKRKGLIFKQSDIHLLFPSPINPKLILLYSHIRTILMALVLNIVMSIGGVLWFDMPVWKMVIYFLISCIIENILEASLMILCYGNERFSKKQMHYFQGLMYLLIVVFVIIGIFMYMREGASMQAVVNYLHSPKIQIVPIIGWYISFIHMLFMGATVWNLIGTILFIASTIIIFILVLRMKCTGDYYEDAIMFAEDYEAVREKGQRGEVAVLGWKKKYGKATVTYKGSYAKALFYRQLLEYKKNRFFIFGFFTLLCFVIGIAMAFLAYRGNFEIFGEYQVFIVLGVMAYLVFVTSSYTGKWGKELRNPYTYLIPDYSFYKLWYATLIEHIRAIVDGCLLTIPISIVLRISWIQMILTILVYVCLQACKLYADVMIEAFLGNLLGATAKQFARLLIEVIVIGFAIIGAVIGTFAISVEVGFIALIVVIGGMTLGMMAIASINFERMETLDS